MKAGRAKASVLGTDYLSGDRKPSAGRLVGFAARLGRPGSRLWTV